MVKLVALAFTVYFATVCFVLLIGIAKQVQSAKFDCLDFKPRSMCDVYEGYVKIGLKFYIILQTRLVC